MIFSSTSRTRANIILLCLMFILFYCIYSISKSFTPSIKESINKPLPYSFDQQKPITRKNIVCRTDRVLRNTDPNHTKAHLSFWQHLSDTTVQVYQRRWQTYISSIKRTDIPSFDGRGIALVAGNRDTFNRALTTIKLLRYQYKCSLPIEIWHLNDEQPNPSVVSELNKLADVTTRDLSDERLIKPIRERRNADKQFQIKAAAIINSSFREVLYLDSDNVPVTDPSFLFDVQEYQATGALFWPDFWKTHGENKIFDVLNIECLDEWEQESGQMVIDKEKSWLPLQLAWYMQKHSDVYFQFLNGDKDTFKYAWQALQFPYHMVEAFVGMGGTMSGDRFCGHTMLQYAPASALQQFNEDESKVLFVHANLLKITNKVHFMHDNKPEHPWDLAKRSSMSYSNTWIKPEFYVSSRGEACMDFTHREGEPEAITQNFDQVVPEFQSVYFKYGGIGGETR
ncbi:mannosyltransferase putative-domain-containing protein [Blakeslea trispora]|nr:mannosyltransferase putative-domain-containing protein [Blakeslea trispora]